MKIVINKCFGGYGLSTKAAEELAKRKGIAKLYWYKLDYPDEGINLMIKCDPKDSGILVIACDEDFGPSIKDSGIIEDHIFHFDEVPRNDSDLVAVVEELGEDACDRFAELKIVEIPDDVEWEIDNYDGIETIHEKHRVWA